MPSSSIRFLLGDQVQRVDFLQSSPHRPTTTLLQYLRSIPDRCGTKEGCAEGDCGACTVVLRSLDDSGALTSTTACSCLVLLPQVAGKQVVTVEDVGASQKASNLKLHPVQQAMVDHGGSQCGFCTPGIVMSLLALYDTDSEGTQEEIEQGLSGNLCRCTGYRPIVEAAHQSLARRRDDPSRSERRAASARALEELHADVTTQLAARGQRYFIPTDLEEAVRLRGTYPDAWIVAGATDLGLRITKAHELPSTLIDLGRVDALRTIREEEGGLFVGATASLSELLEACRGRHSAMVEMLEVFGSTQIRNRGTIGGNLGTASPIGDTLPVLIASEATIFIEGPSGRRSVPMEDFVTGYRQTALAAGELIAGVFLPWPAEGEHCRAYKISRRRDLDISTVSLAASITLDSTGVVTRARLAFGAMDARARRVSAAEGALVGSPLTEASARAAAALVREDFRPLSDVRASAQLRSLAAHNLVLALWRDLSEQDGSESSAS